jgi:hypothetical protein
MILGEHAALLGLVQWARVGEETKKGTEPTIFQVFEDLVLVDELHTYGVPLYNELQTRQVIGARRELSTADV